MIGINKCLVVIFLLFVSNAVLGANHYIRIGATGRNDGSDWNNDFNGFPSTFVRGDMYYVAGGEYPGQLILDTPDDGRLIILKKEIAVECASVPGWHVSFEDQVLQYYDGSLNTAVIIKSKNWIIDGAKRTDRGSNYGWKIKYGKTSTDSFFF